MSFSCILHVFMSPVPLTRYVCTVVICLCLGRGPSASTYYIGLNPSTNPSGTYKDGSAAASTDGLRDSGRERPTAPITSGCGERAEEKMSGRASHYILRDSPGSNAGSTMSTTTYTPRARTKANGKVVKLSLYPSLQGS